MSNDQSTMRSFAVVPHKNHSTLSPDLLIKIYNLMLKSRVLEERLINMFKQDQGFFWIGGPGEEAFNTCLGLQINKGMGLEYDYFHHHYRSSAVLLAMGMDPIDPIRQMRNTALDSHSGGRNFSSHYSIPEWNIIPGTSTIETQYLTAIGTALAQKQQHSSGITIVNGGDAGTAEGDFASCLVWASRPKNELPILIIVNNNKWGISTAAHMQHGEKNIADRANAFRIENTVINGNDVEESYFSIKRAITYVREKRKPFLIEAKVSRLYGHSSASGAGFHPEEIDPICLIEKKLIDQTLLTREEMSRIRDQYTREFRILAENVNKEPQPSSESIHDFIYWNQKGKYW